MADDNAIPVRIGHYEILKTIGKLGPNGGFTLCPCVPPLTGKGNFAVVKLARHTITNLMVGLFDPFSSMEFNSFSLPLRWPSK